MQLSRIEDIQYRSASDLAFTRTSPICRKYPIQSTSSNGTRTNIVPIGPGTANRKPLCRNAIDEAVYDLFDLTGEERDVIEGYLEVF